MRHGEQCVHDARGQQNLSVCDRWWLPICDARVKALNEFLDAAVLVQPPAQDVPRVAHEIAAMLARLDERGHDEGEVALVALAEVADDAAADKVDCYRARRPEHAQLIDAGLDLRREVERSRRAARVAQQRSHLVLHLLATQVAHSSALLRGYDDFSHVVAEEFGEAGDAVADEVVEELSWQATYPV